MKEEKGNDCRGISSFFGGWQFGYAVVVLLHLGLVGYFVPLAVVFEDAPISGNDMEIHVYQAFTVAEALSDWGASWAYDPNLLAGFPTGTIFDADNKGLELWTFALHAFGLPVGISFNLFFLFVHALVPFVLFVAARNLGFDPIVGVVAAALGSGFWFFDGTLHWCWWEGMVGYASVAYLSLLPLTYGFRFLNSGRSCDAFALAVSLAFVHLIHAYAFWILVVPLVVFYILAFRAGWKFHAVVVGIVGVTLGVNLYWIWNAFEALKFIVPIPELMLGSSTPYHLMTDFLGVFTDERITGAVHPRTGVRFLVLIAGAMFFAKSPVRDRRWAYLLLSSSVMLAIALFGGYFWFVRQIQPYRHYMPAVFILALPAAAYIVDLASRFVKLPTGRAVIVVIVFTAALVRIGADVVYFTTPTGRGPSDVHPSELVFFSGQRHAMRYENRFPSFDPVCEWFQREGGSKGRVLVQNWKLGERMTWKTDAQILGGFEFRSLKHNPPHLFRRFPNGIVPAEVLAIHISQYAVDWIVVSKGQDYYDSLTGLLRPVADIGPHRVYRSVIPVSLFKKGKGELDVSLNRIRVTNSDPGQELVLRFHFDDRLICGPNCRIEREAIPADEIGFIKVLAPHPTDFEIINGY